MRKKLLTGAVCILLLGILLFAYVGREALRPGDGNSGGDQSGMDKIEVALKKSLDKVR